MERHEQQLLEALRAFLRNGAPEVLLTDDGERQRFWALAAEQKVLPMAAEALSRSGVEIPPEIRRSAARTAALQFRRAAAFARVYGDLSARGLEPLVVKGAVCRALYPRPELRPSADEDLLCPPEQFPALLEALEQMGFAVSLLEGDPVAACRQPETGLYLEVHRTLFPPDSRAYGGLNRFFDGAFARSIEVTAEGCVLRTLCPQDHLLYLILHSFKHFLHSGFGIRQVCDICLYAAAYGREIHWPALTASLREVRADVFAAGLLEIGRQHLGVRDFGPAAEAWLDSLSGGPDCGDLLADLLSGGVYGGNSEARQHSSRITLAAASGGGRSRQVLRTLFPARKDLEGRFPYLKRHPLLLPMAYVQRIVRYGKEAPASAARESLTIGRQRVELLKKYKILP
ncbi:nucleotidyltransferase domain-containing protein [Dysosmobacter sp.]|uniref:nucleotidyltransferase domain-containing protein n=1 Tax=Dysosmobacter sp. TaxID=2591382 RepID=UPI002A8BF6CB|nr:nucleotidyltransferase family protein [Dysosmobacter sp.]MDY3281462.1 nucleotidyltransferase family protein [Dysosmobacter sp.]